MPNPENRPQIGVGVIIVRDKKVLLGKRKNAHGESCWGFPGGHLEFAEHIDECAKREALEETNLRVTDVQLGPYTNDIFIAENKHYLTIFAICIAEGEPHVMEPHKCERWEWFLWNELPTPLFLPVQNLKESGFEV